jgi:hypothetical protein
MPADKPNDGLPPLPDLAPGVKVEEQTVTESRTVTSAVPEPTPPVPVVKETVVTTTSSESVSAPPPAAITAPAPALPFAKPLTNTVVETQTVSVTTGMSTMTKTMIVILTLVAIVAVAFAVYTVYTAYLIPQATNTTDTTPPPATAEDTPDTVNAEIVSIYQNDSVGYQIGLVDNYEAIDWQSVMPGQTRTQAGVLTRDVAILSEGRNDGGYTILLSYRNDFNSQEDFLAAMEENEFTPDKYYSCFEISENNQLNQVEGVLRGEGVFPCNAEITQKYFVKNFFWLDSKNMGVSMWIYYADAEALDRSVVDKMVNSFRLL